MSLLERGLFPTGPTPSSFDHNELMPFHQADQDLKRKDKSIFTSNKSGASPAATFYSGWPEWEAPYPSPPPLCSPVDLVATGAARCCSRSMVGSAERAKWKCKSRWRQPEPAVPRFPLCRGRADWLCGKCCLNSAQLARSVTSKGSDKLTEGHFQNVQKWCRAERRETDHLGDKKNYRMCKETCRQSWHWTWNQCSVGGGYRRFARPKWKTRIYTSTRVDQLSLIKEDEKALIQARPKLAYEICGGEIRIWPTF